jgi:hypothetical protein
MESKHHFFVNWPELPKFKRNPYGRTGVYRGKALVSPYAAQHRKARRKQARAIPPNERIS